MRAPARARAMVCAAQSGGYVTPRNRGQGERVDDALTLCLRDLHGSTALLKYGIFTQHLKGGKWRSPPALRGAITTISVRCRFPLQTTPPPCARLERGDPLSVTRVNLDPTLPRDHAVPREHLSLIADLHNLNALIIAPPAAAQTCPWPPAEDAARPVAELVGALPKLAQLALHRVGLGDKGARELAIVLRDARPLRLAALDLSLNMVTAEGGAARFESAINNLGPLRWRMRRARATARCSSFGWWAPQRACCQPPTCRRSRRAGAPCACRATRPRPRATMTRAQAEALRAALTLERAASR